MLYFVRIYMQGSRGVVVEVWSSITEILRSIPTCALFHCFKG
jgi:hypothetical protein